MSNKFDTPNNQTQSPIEQAEPLLDPKEEARKERIKSILSLSMGIIPKAELVLVALGLKPATDIHLSNWNSAPDVFEEAVKKASLSFVRMERPDVNWAEYAVAQTPELAERLKVAKPSRDHLEFGKLMGFPETAIEAFVNKNIASDDDLPEDQEIVMGSFKLSKEHWKEEQEVKRQWSRAIEQYAPDVYRALRKMRGYGEGSINRMKAVFDSEEEAIELVKAFWHAMPQGHDLVASHDGNWSQTLTAGDRTSIQCSKIGADTGKWTASFSGNHQALSPQAIFWLKKRGVFVE